VLVDDPAQCEDGPTAPPPDDTGPDNAAYLAYTSGSTGRPKGVLVPHRAVLRLVRGDFLALGPGDAMLQLAPVAFDASTLELWGPLLNGARLAVHPPGEVTPQSVTDAVQQERVTALWLTAGLFHRVADGPLEPLSSLRVLFAGGDVLSVRHVNRLLDALPGLRLVNGYGPTENTTFTCTHEMTSPVTEETVPIGRPVRGTEVHLLDDRLRPVPDGEPGELYAGGTGVADGYLGQPAGTAERFLPDPYGSRPGGRLYRTGDMARRLPGGALEFLGRVDDQVKIRGFRVEPGEVEAALRQVAEVTDCAVVARQEPRGGRKLVAYATAERPLHVPAVRRGLAAVLPAHAVPAAIVQLDALPLTANGKLDRRALAGMRLRERPECDAEFRPPTGRTERWLAQLWSDLLEIDRVGVDDDFFELGGHSLMAASITGEIAETHGVLVTAREFYENPTIAELAELITTMHTPARQTPVGNRPQGGTDTR
jgi:amino acid adenylation domain-containing protein